MGYSIFAPTIDSVPGLQAALDAKAALAGAAFTGAVTVNNGTLTASAPATVAQQVWNNAAVTFTAAKIEITDTASAAGSRFLDMIVGGSSKLFVTKAGVLNLPAGAYPATPVICGPTTTTGIAFYTGVNILHGSAECGSALANSIWGVSRLFVSGTGNAPSGTGLSGGVMLELAAAGVGAITNAAGSYRDLRLRSLLDTNGVQVVGTRGAAVADATDAASAITQLNALLARLRATGGHGLISD